MRGAEIRDAFLWYKYLHRIITLYPEMEVLCNSHHWQYEIWQNLAIVILKIVVLT